MAKKKMAKQVAAMETNLGNIKLKVKDASTAFKVHKCPYIGCTKQFLEKKDLYQHLQLDHEEAIEKIKPKVSFSKTVNLNDIDQMLITVNRQHLRYYAMLVGELFEPKPKKIRLPSPKVATPTELPRKKGIIAIILEIFKKKGKNNGR